MAWCAVGLMFAAFILLSLQSYVSLERIEADRYAHVFVFLDADGSLRVFGAVRGIESQESDVTHPDDREVWTVKYVGVVSSRWEGIGRRRYMVYWSTRAVILPDGARVAPMDGRVVPGLLLAADPAFERLLPGGTAYFGWDNGLSTWRETTVNTDGRHLAHFGMWVSWLSALVGAGVLWATFAWREWLTRRRIVRRRCWLCGYRLEGLEHDAACPECGQDVVRIR